MNWPSASFDTTQVLYGYWLTGNPQGEGAVITYATKEQGCNSIPTTLDFAYRVITFSGGTVSVSAETAIVANVEGPCGDYFGSTLRSNGVLYQSVFENPSGGTTTCTAAEGTKPLKVYISSGSVI